jgi:hypothetical protein
MAIEDGLSGFPGVVDLAGKRREREANSHELQEIQREKLDLLAHVDDGHLFKRMAQSIAQALWLPESTVFMVGLGVFSAIASRRFAIRYDDGEPLPLGLYVVAEQPSGTAKSRCLSIWEKPFNHLAATLNKKLQADISRLSVLDKPTDDEKLQLKQLKQKRNSHLFINETTPEGLEVSLIGTDGYFACVSAEQGLFNTLLGLSYGDGKRKNNNDLLLRGYNGEIFCGHRANRECYSGYVAGAVVLFAQEGSYANVFHASNGTGLSERFLVMSEPDLMGYRDHTLQLRVDAGLLEQYKYLCYSLENDILNPADIDDLFSLTLSNTAFKLIAEFRNTIEPLMRQGNPYSHRSAKSTGSKIDIPVMKIAGLLHVIEAKDWYGQMEVDDKHVVSAIAICKDLFDSMIRVCSSIGAMGENAKVEAVLSIYNGNPKPRSMRELHQTLKNKVAFRDIDGNKAAYIKETVLEMVSKGFLLRLLDSMGRDVYMIN